MHFLEKNTLFVKHQNADALKADKKLLEEKNPNAKSLKVKFFDKVKEAKETLYELLDVASEEEILKNRKKRMRAFPKPANKPEEVKPENSDKVPEPGEEITGTEEETSDEGSKEPLPPVDIEEKKSEEAQVPEPGAEPAPQE